MDVSDWKSNDNKLERNIGFTHNASQHYITLHYIVLQKTVCKVFRWIKDRGATRMVVTWIGSMFDLRYRLFMVVPCCSLIRILGVTFRLVWISSFASPDGQHWATSSVSRLSGFRWSWACGLHTVFPTFSSPLDREFKMRLLDWVAANKCPGSSWNSMPLCHILYILPLRRLRRLKFWAMLNRVIAVFLFSAVWGYRYRAEDG